MSTFPDRLYQMGGVPVGSSMYGMKGNSEIYFVDYDSGSDGNVGTSPTKAFKTIYKAVTVANAWDVIYIAPRGHVSNNLWIGTAYQETTDLSITYAKQGLAMIGIGHQAIRGKGTGVAIREKSASTECVLKVHAPYCAFENLAFENESTAVNGLYIYGDVLLTSEAQETSVYNCHFYNLDGAGNTGDTGGALYVDGSWGTTVDSCSFYQCGHGISLKSDTRTSGNFLIINNVFSTYGTDGSGIACDVYVYTQGATSLVIANNYFAHLLPSKTSGESRYVSVQADVRQGLIANNYLGHSGTLTEGGSGTGIVCPGTVGKCHNYCHSALMADA